MADDMVKVLEHIQVLQCILGVFDSYLVLLVCMCIVFSFNSLKKLCCNWRNSLEELSLEFLVVFN